MIFGMIFLAILLVAGITVVIFINNIEKKTYDFLVKEVQQGTDGLYVFSPGKINISLTKGSITMKEPSLQCDTVKLAELIELKRNPKIIYDIHLKEISLKTDGLLSIYKQKRLNVDLLEVDDPIIKITQYHHGVVHPDSARHHADSTTRLFPSFIHGVALNEILIKNASFQYRVEEHGGKTVFAGEGINIDAKNLDVNSFFKISKDLPNLKSLTCSFDDLTYYMKSYTIKAHHIDLDMNNFALLVGSWEVIPKYNKHDFAYKAGMPARAECSGSKISLWGIDFYALLTEQNIYADSLIINDFTLSNYKNKNVSPTPVTKPLFQEMVQQLPMQLDIPMVFIKNGHVTHEELGKNRLEAGKIEFVNISGTIDGLTNIVRSKDQYMTITAHGKILKSSSMFAEMRLPVDPKNEIFTFRADVSNPDLMNLNYFIEPTAHMSIESGASERIKFSITGNSKVAHIEMLLLYNDLELAILKADSEKKRWLLSELANDLILIANNPEKGKKERVGKGVAHRDPHLYQFNYLWLTIFEGIKESVGFTHKKQEMIYKLTHPQETKKERQEKRKEKKEKRKKK